MSVFRPLFFFALLSIGLISFSDFSSGWTNSKSLIPDTTLSFIHNPSSQKWEKDWSKENTIVYHWRAEPDNLHPTNGKSNPRRIVMDYTQRFLVNVDFENLVLRPDLVKALPEISSDGLSYTYELRDEPTWDDGSPLTVDDVIFTLMANKCPLTNNAFAKPYIEKLKNITRDPAHPRKFTLIVGKINIQNTAFLGDIPIISKKYFDPKNVLGKFTMTQFDNPDFTIKASREIIEWAKEFNDAKYGRDINYLNGLGAYKVTAWEDKQRIELTKKTKHWTSKVKNPDMYDAAYPEKITFKVNVDDYSIALELKKQTIDVSTWISTTGLTELQKDSDFNRNYYSAFVPNFNYQYLGMNLKPGESHRMPFFTDKRVRRAMALLVPVDKINQMYLQGKAVRQTTMVSPLKKNIYDQSLEDIPFDIEKAKSLLDEAGWKDSDGDNIRDKTIDGTQTQFEFELLIISGNTATENIAKDIQAAMSKAGIKAKIKSLDFVTFYENIQQHKFDMYFGAWAGTFSPDDYRQIWYSSSWTDGSNYTGFGNTQSDALIDSINVTLDDKKRNLLEKRLQQIVYDEQPYIFLFMVPSKIAIHKRFANNNMYFEKPGVYLSNLRLINQ